MKTWPIALCLALSHLASHDAHGQSAPPTLRGSIDYPTTLRYGMDWADEDTVVQSTPPIPTLGDDYSTNLGHGTDRIQNASSRNAANNANIRRGLENALIAADLVAGALAFKEGYDALDTSDVAYDPAELARGGPQVPTSCSESEDCYECYAPAVRSLNTNRVTLGKAWALARSTIVFAEQAVALGDSFAGLHPSAGITWNFGSKRDVNKSLDELRATYARRYRDFITALERNLRELGECEARFYGQDDWYDRFGYLFLAFMEAKYEHPDP